MAAKLNMDVAYLSKIERGNRMARREQVIAFAKALQEDEHTFLNIWLSEQIVDLLKNEKDFTEILKNAEKEIKNLTHKNQ